MLGTNEMDKVRRDIPSSTFIKRAIEQYLRKGAKWLQRQILRPLLEQLPTTSSCWD